MAKEKEKPKEKPKEKKSSQKQEPKEAKATHAREAGVYPRLLDMYKKDLALALMKRFNYKTVMQVPRLEKISINMGIGAATQDAKLLETAAKELELITGQKPAITKAKKSYLQFQAPPRRSDWSPRDVARQADV
jgi:large subunit ribosomal protein L5